MAAHTLKDPEYYMAYLNDLRERNKYAKNWVMRLECKTNRHPETGGADWGWYEIFPLGITVGYWGSTKDDLKEVDRIEWNRKAEKLSKGES